MHSPKLSPGGSVSFLFVFVFGSLAGFSCSLFYILIVALVEQYYGYLLYDFISIIIVFFFDLKFFEIHHMTYISSPEVVHLLNLRSVLPLSFLLVFYPLMNFYHSVEWAIALHGMYKSTSVFISILKLKNLYIVGCVHLGHNSIFPAARIKIQL